MHLHAVVYVIALTSFIIINTYNKGYKAYKTFLTWPNSVAISSKSELQHKWLVTLVWGILFWQRSNICFTCIHPMWWSVTVPEPNPPIQLTRYITTILVQSPVLYYMYIILPKLHMTAMNTFGCSVFMRFLAISWLLAGYGPKSIHFKT